jgi:hypothetical protein
MNKFTDIINAMRNGRTTKFTDIEGKLRYQCITGIRCEGGKDIWLVQTLNGEVCIKAA